MSSIFCRNCRKEFFLKKIDGKIYVFLIFRVKKTKRLLLEGIKIPEPMRKTQIPEITCPKCRAGNVEMRNINSKNVEKLIKKQFKLE